VVTRDYANGRQLTIGDELTIRDTALTVIGIAKPPLGRETSDISSASACSRRFPSYGDA
jgi:hypothetical protein